MNIQDSIFKRAYNSARIRISRTVVPLLLRSSSVKIGKRTNIIGYPIVRSVSGSLIKVNDKVTFISWNWATALGVNHPVILRTFQKDAQIVIGEGTGISGGTFCAAKAITIGRDCLFGANVTVVDTDFHHIDSAFRHDPNACHRDALPVSIGDNVFIGMGSMILKGVSIGDNTVVGAGSVVSKSIPENVIAAGNPCRVIRELECE